MEVLQLPSTSDQVIEILKITFARLLILDEVMSDNGLQFSSAEFQELARQLEFKHITSPQGHAERAEKTAKRILRQEDPLVAVMWTQSSRTRDGKEDQNDNPYTREKCFAQMAQQKDCQMIH